MMRHYTSAAMEGKRIGRPPPPMGSEGPTAFARRGGSTLRAAPPLPLSIG